MVPKWLAVGLVCVSAGVAQGAATLEGFTLGSHVSGPKVGPEDWKGRVVLVEYWGAQCPPCLASIPHLGELQAQVGRDRLVVIANHCQGFDDAAALAAWKGNKGSDGVAVVNNGRLPGAQVSGIPHCFLFSHEGKLLYEGSPFEMNAPLEAALKASPGFLVAGREYVKTAKQAATIGAMRSNLSGVIKSLRLLAKSNDEQGKEEAEYLLARMDAYAQESLSKIQASRTDDPLSANETLGRMSALFSGDTIGVPFKDLSKELAGDKKFQMELKAAVALSQLRQQAGKLGLDTDADTAKQNRQAVSSLSSGLQALVRKFPDTRAASEAQELAKRWGI